MATESVLTPLLHRWEKYVEFSDEERSAILSLPYRQRSMGRDQHIVREGEQSQNCCLILEGFAYRHKVTGEGARQIISIHMRGEFVDLQNSLLGTADHNVQTLTRSEVALIPHNALQDLMMSHHGIGRAMWIDTLIDSSIFREWVVNVGRRDAQTRVAHLLCELMMRMELAGLTDEQGYDLPLTQAQLADATGLTSVHVNRVLRALREAGLISLDVRSLRILDLKRLRQVGDFHEVYLHHEMMTPRPATAAA